MRLYLTQMSDPLIVRATAPDYPELISVWEASVRATHHFLSEADIQAYKRLILTKSFDSMQLYCIKAEDIITSFIGVDKELLQLLFIHPDWRGKGVGKILLRYAIEDLSVTEVDVNEQNKQALGFYYHMGFELIERFEHDSIGKPYPVLTMALKS